MSKLLAYNLTGAPLSLAAGNPVVPDLPASAAPPARGPAVNVTAELQNLTGPDYVALQAQVDAGDVAFAWDGYPNYETPGLETDSPLTGAGGDAIGSPIVWRHDAVSPPPGVYSTFEEAHAEATARVAAGLGPQKIYLDRSDSTFIGQSGQPTCPVPTGVWDMSDIGLYAFGEGTFQFLSILEGAYLDNLQNFGGDAFIVTINEAQVAGGIRSSGTVRVNGGCSLYLRCRNAASLPIFQNQGFTELYVAGGAELRLGDSSLIGPVIDADGGDFIFNWQGGGWVRDQSLTDTAGGGVFDFQLSSEAAGIVASSANWDQPGIAGSLVFGDLSLSRVRWKQLLGPIGFGDSPYDAATGGIVDVYDIDTSGGEVVFNMPRNAPIAGETCMVVDATGDAATNPVTINCSGTDTFADGSTSKTLSTPFGMLKFISDGFGVWRQENAEPSPVTTVRFRQEAAAPAPGTYATWQEAYDSARAATRFGPVALIFDSSESTHVTSGGRPACLIPAGAWDFEDITVQGTIQPTPNFSNPGSSESNIELADGCVITGLRSTSGLGSVQFIYNGLTDGAIIISGYHTFLTSTTFWNEDAGAGAILKVAGFGVVSFEKGNTYGGLGWNVQIPAAEPTVDLAGGFLFLLSHNGIIGEDCAKDTVGGGFFFQARSNDSDGQDVFGAGSYQMPTLEAAGGSTASAQRYPAPRRASLILNPAGDAVVSSADSPFTITFYGDILPVDTSGGPVTVILPSIGAPSEVYDQEIRIYDSSNQADANPITVLCAPRDVFSRDGSKSKVISSRGGHIDLLAGGVGGWGITSSSELEGAPGPFAGVASTNANIGDGTNGPGTAAAEGWAQMQVRIPGVKSDGSITAVQGSLLVDTDNFVLDDGANPAVTFEFDSDDSVVETTTLKSIDYNVAETDNFSFSSNLFGQGVGGFTGGTLHGKLLPGQTVTISGTVSNNATFTVLFAIPGVATFVAEPVVDEGPVNSTATQDDTAANMAIGIADAISRVGFENLFITGTSAGAAVTLEGVVGTTGNVAITNNVADGGFSVTGMANGVDDVDAMKWVQYWS